MIHEKIKLHVPGSADYAAMYTYFLDLSKEVPIEKRPTVIVCPGGAYAFTSDREAEPIAMRFNAIGMNDNSASSRRPYDNSSAINTMKNGE